MAELFDLAPTALLITAAFFLGLRGFGTNWTTRRKRVEEELGREQDGQDNEKND